MAIWVIAMAIVQGNVIRLAFPQASNGMNCPIPKLYHAPNPFAISCELHYPWLFAIVLFYSLLIIKNRLQGLNQSRHFIKKNLRTKFHISTTSILPLNVNEQWCSLVIALGQLEASDFVHG
ncbi:hypothetical protein EBZ02_08565 [bacterium]|nr:hypothetical protein [bacterium]